MKYLMGRFALDTNVYEGNVHVDSCPHCSGVWPDRGELKALEVFYDRSQKSTSGWAYFLSTFCSMF